MVEFLIKLDEIRLILLVWLLHFYLLHEVSHATYNSSYDLKIRFVTVLSFMRRFTVALRNIIHETLKREYLSNKKLAARA